MCPPDLDMFSVVLYALSLSTYIGKYGARFPYVLVDPLKLFIAVGPRRCLLINNAPEFNMSTIYGMDDGATALDSKLWCYACLFEGSRNWMSISLAISTSSLLRMTWLRKYSSPLCLLASQSLLRFTC